MMKIIAKTSWCPDCDGLGEFLNQVGMRCLFQCLDCQQMFHDYIENVCNIEGGD